MTSYRITEFFNPMDVVVLEGHTIQLVISESGEDYLPSPCASLGMTIFAGYQVLTLPTIDRPMDHENWFQCSELVGRIIGIFLSLPRHSLAEIVTSKFSGTTLNDVSTF